MFQDSPMRITVELNVLANTKLGGEALSGSVVTNAVVLAPTPRSVVAETLTL